MLNTRKTQTDTVRAVTVFDWRTKRRRKLLIWSTAATGHATSPQRTNNWLHVHSGQWLQLASAVMVV